MVYIGTRNTFFCWHVEDNNLYATNYVVAGAPKIWYGVPLHAMDAMEQAWRNAFPALYTRHPDLQYWKTSIFSPALLVAAGVPVFRLTAEPGTFVFTEPGAYHCGMNTGFNVAESTNFAFSDWLPAGDKALARYRTPPMRDSTLLHDALLCVTAHHGRPAELRDLVPHLRAAHRSEADARARLAAAGVRVPPEPTAPPAPAEVAAAGGVAGGNGGGGDGGGGDGGGGDGGGGDGGGVVGGGGDGSGGSDGGACAAAGWPTTWDHAQAERDSWRCRVCRHLCFFSVVRCACEAHFHLCPEHGLHTPEQGGKQPVAYIHYDEDELLDPTIRGRSHPLEMGRRFSGAAGGFASGTAGGAGAAGPPPSAPPSPPSEAMAGRRFSGATGGYANGVAANGTAGGAGAAGPPPSAPPSPPYGVAANGTAGGAGAVGPPPSAPPSEATAPVAAPTQQWVRFSCQNCSRRLKAPLPPQHTRRIKAKCANCNLAMIMSVVMKVQPDGSLVPEATPYAPEVKVLPPATPAPQFPHISAPPVVGTGATVVKPEPPCAAAGEQPSFARPSRSMGGGRMGGGPPQGSGPPHLLAPCTCGPMMRQLIVRHPLKQIEELVCSAEERVQQAGEEERAGA